MQGMAHLKNRICKRPILPLCIRFAVASINYRLSQHTLFPAQIEDCKAAVRFIRAHAKEWGIDPTRIGVLGFSAGGKTAAMAALACGKRLYAPQDDVDAAPCNADFGVLVYPAYLVDKNNQQKQRKYNTK